MINKRQRRIKREIKKNGKYKKSKGEIRREKKEEENRQFRRKYFFQLYGEKPPKKDKSKSKEVK